MSNHTVKVWDPMVRLFHWTVMAAFTISYVSEDEWLDLHVASGYLVGGLVLFRLIWGVIGTHHARFSDFVRRPATVMVYLKEIVGMHPRRYLGHNPAGGAMVVAMLLLLAATSIAGLAVYGAEEAAGPMAGWMSGLGHEGGELFEELHEVLANLTLLLVLVHIAGVVVASLQHRENLVVAMVTGRKRA